MILDQPKPEFIATEVLPMMARMGLVVGKIFEPADEIQTQVKKSFGDCLSIQVATLSYKSLAVNRLIRSWAKVSSPNQS